MVVDVSGLVPGVVASWDCALFLYKLPGSPVAAFSVAVDVELNVCTEDELALGVDCKVDAMVVDNCKLEDALEVVDCAVEVLVVELLDCTVVVLLDAVLILVISGEYAKSIPVTPKIGGGCVNCEICLVDDEDDGDVGS